MSEIRSQATPAYKAVANRRAATHALHHDLIDGGPKIDAKFSDIHHMAGNAIKAGWLKPRTVNSATELDALPELSVVLVGGQLAAQKDLAWFATGGEEPVEFNEEAWKAGIVVLFTPGDVG